jgi:phosphoglycolate phosphatase-like HAD superfamily hydrolase
VSALLALFDVDGTLFLTDDRLASEALLATLRELYPVEPPEDAVEQVDHQGQTAKRIARLVLNAERMDDAAVDERLDECCRRFAARYVTMLAGADTSAWRAAPTAAEALTRLQDAGVRLALLTGNPEPMARARMFRLGLERFFPEGQGAFGCESESRIELIELARRRAGGWPAEQTVEIGDTPRDAETADAASVRSIVVGPERGLTEVADLLLAWNEGDVA